MNCEIALPHFDKCKRDICGRCANELSSYGRFTPESSHRRSGINFQSIRKLPVYHYDRRPIYLIATDLGNAKYLESVTKGRIYLPRLPQIRILHIYGAQCNLQTGIFLHCTYLTIRETNNCMKRAIIYAPYLQYCYARSVVQMPKYTYILLCTVAAKGN